MKRRLWIRTIMVTVLGLLLCIAVHEVGLRIVGSVFLASQEHKNRQAVKRKNAYLILCLGESLTIEYPELLEEILNRKDTGIRFEVINEGIAEAGSAAIVSRLEHNLDKYNKETWKS